MEDQEAPREDAPTNTSKAGRKSLEANLDAHQYLAKILTDPQYRGESGERPEEEIMYAITKLIEEDGLVVANYSNSEATSVYCTGAYLAGNCPVVCWSADDRQAYLNAVDPESRNGFRASRALVRA